MIKFSFKKNIFNDRFVFALSLVLAIILWIFVSISFSPTVTKDISGISVTIPLENTSNDGLKLFGTESYSVSVKIQGKKYITDSVSVGDISVSANIGKIIGTGVNTLQLSAEALSSDDFEILSISPSSLVVYLDYEEQKTLPIEVEYKGATVSKENYFLEAGVSDAFKNITITGARNELQQIAKAVLVADVNEELSSTKVFKGNVKLYDSSDNEMKLEYSTLSFDSADVTVGVQEQILLPLTITPINAPENLPDIKIYRMVNNKPTIVSEITVKRDPNLIDTLNEISLGMVDFSKLDKNRTSWSYEFKLPSIGGISYPSISSVNDEVFKVVISTEGLTFKTFDIDKSSIVISGASKDSNVSVQTESLQGITVVSTVPSQLSKLKASDITAVVDVSALESGSHSCNKVTFKIKNNPNSWVVVPGDATFDVAVKIE